VNPRLRRAAKLIDLADSAERAARAQSVLAERALSEARSSLQAAEARWTTAASQPAPVARSADLEEEAAYLRALRAKADAAARGVEQASVAERRAAADLVRAATERRKLEMWRDRMIEADRTEEARKERLANDELAASRAERGRP
jgi:hypothetical protein